MFFGEKGEKFMSIFNASGSSGAFAAAQRFDKSFMLPIAVLPAAGLLLGIGGALSNPNSIKAYPVLDITWWQHVFTIMAAAGNIVFANLAILFAVGIAVGLARSDKGKAGLAAVLAFLVMNSTINALLKASGSRGVLRSGKGVQVIYGPQVSVIKNEVEELMHLDL